MEKIYIAKYMSDLDLRDCVGLARAEQTILDYREKNHLDFASMLIHRFYSSKSVLEKLDILCTLWIFVAKKHKIVFQDSDTREELWDNDVYEPSFEILESIGHAFRCGGIIREHRFFDVSRNIEEQISKLGYDPRFAIREKVGELQGAWRNRARYFSDMHSKGYLDISDRKRVMRGELDSFCGFSKYTPNYELARITSFLKLPYLNVEPFNKIKHYKLNPFWGRAKRKKLEDSLSEYWVDKDEGRAFAYGAIYRKSKGNQNA